MNKTSNRAEKTLLDYFYSFYILFIFAIINKEY